MSLLNLMPPQSKQDIMFARRNRKLVRVCIALVGIIGLMGIVVLFGGVYIDRSGQSLQSSITDTQTVIDNEKLEAVQKDYQDLSTGVKLIVSILQKEVRFSKLLQQIGSVIPSKTLLTSIVLSDKIDNAIDLQARSIDIKTATQLQINLQDPANKLFDKVDQNSVTCTPAPASSGQQLSIDQLLSVNYPCTISLRAQFKKDASFLFINGPAKSTTTGAKQ